MFKRTNKTWKALALVLALCMLSTVGVFAADEPTSITLGDADVVYNADQNIVTVTGKIGVPGTDVTILAVRSTSETGITLSNATAGAESGTGIGNEKWTTATLQQQVVYIDQITATEAAEKNFTFSFIPRSGVGGKYITVFVGGANVAEPKAVTKEVAPLGPTLVPLTWYKGEKLAFALRKADKTTPYPNADAWWTAVTDGETDNMTLNGTVTAFDSQLGTIDDDTVVYVTDASALEETGVTAAAIKDVAGVTNYTDATWSDTTALKATPKPAGALTAIGADNAAVAGEKASIPLTLTNAYDDGSEWTEAIDYTSVTVASGANELALAADDVVVEDEVLKVKVDILTDKATATTDTVTVTVAVDNYAEASTTVAVVAPTKAAADDAEVVRNYVKVEEEYDTDPASVGETEQDTTLLLNMYGFAVVTLPTPAAESGLTYAWEIEDPVGAEETAAIGNNAASVTLDRPDYVAPGSETADTVDEYVYTLTLTVTKDGYAEATKEFTVSASRVGMKGANIEINHNFASADIAAAATYTLTPALGGTPIVIEVAEGKFTANAVALGDYVLKIERPGYMTKTVTVTVGSTGLAAFEMPAMVAGDLDDSGVVDGSDVSALGVCWGATTGGTTYQEYADLDGSGVVDGADISLLGVNWGVTR